MYQRDLAYIHASGFHGLAAGAAPEILRRLRDAQVRSVVDVGCGAGPLSKALVAAGFSVTGIDPSPDFLRMATKNVPGATFLLGSAYELELPPCQAILAVGEPLTYHPPDSDAHGRLSAFFRKAAAALPPAGLLIFDLIERAGDVQTRNWAAGEDWAVLVEVREAGEFLTRHIETFVKHGDAYRRGLEVHHARRFEAAWIVSQLEGCGFQVETGRSYGEHALAPRRSAFFATRI